MEISVIIPIKNRAYFIRATLDSILGQTLPPKEIILVNDHSTDNLVEALEPYKTRITLIHSTKPGPGAARNAGLNRATGNYIQFFDSDDIMSPNKLYLQANLLKKNWADVAYGPFVKARELKIESPKRNVEKYNVRNIDSFYFLAGYWMQEDVIMQYYPVPDESKLLDYVAMGWCPITQSCLFTREIVEKTKGWREDVFTHEDLDFWFQIAMNNPRMAHSNQCIVIYRQHDIQLTNEKAKEIQFTKNHLSVLSDWEKTIRSRLARRARVYFQARRFNSERFLRNAGIAKTTMKKWNMLHLFIFRCFNKYERWKTGSLWERMHGTSSKTIKFS